MTAKLKLLYPADLSLEDYNTLAIETCDLVRRYLEAGPGPGQGRPSREQVDLIYEIGEIWLYAFTKTVLEDS